MKAPMGSPPKIPSPPSNSDISDAVVGNIAGDTGALCEAVNSSTPTPATDIEATEKPIPRPSRKGSLTSYDSQRAAVPYTIPPWSEPPEHPFSLEVLKDGTIIDHLDVSAKGVYIFGRVDLCDFVLEHPTISRFHAVLQFGKDDAYLYDLGSTHGTFLNKSQVKKKVYNEIHVGDILRFGHSSRLYILQGPSELMPPEGDLEKIRMAKIQDSLLDREASLLRAREEASLANGISWGMGEDTIEEDPENGAAEITWQTYRGKLTERQEKTHSKIIKRMEKVSNMKKEIDAIRAKDIAQGGLTLGQQMQIARNEQRTSQIKEELDNLEETLNDSIRESIGACAGRSISGKRKGNIEEEEAILSDDDEFYDRTRKKSAAKNSGELQSVETADSLLDKMDAIYCEIEEKKKQLAEEREKSSPNKEKAIDGEDYLDAYMSGLSSQLVIDRTTQIEKTLSDLQVELDRTKFLLKIADPTGEAARKREGKVMLAVVSQSNQSIIISRQPQDEKMENIIAIKPSKKSCRKTSFQSIPAEKLSEKGKGISTNKEEKACTIVKPQWLGATRVRESEDDHILETNSDAHEPGDFVDYKDRKKFLAPVDDDGDFEHAAPGLIIRKRKPLENAKLGSEEASKMALSSPHKSETAAADAVALLLKHKRGYHALGEVMNEEQNVQFEGQPHNEILKPRRVHGPARPNLLDRSPDYESWVPPDGQTGDGRTSLNDRLGY